MWSNKRWVECMLNLKEKNELGFPQCRRVKWLSLKSPAVNASKLWPRGGWTLASVSCIVNTMKLQSALQWLTTKAHRLLNKVPAYFSLVYM